MAKIITLGEIMLRLSPEDEPRTVGFKARLGAVSQLPMMGSVTTSNRRAISINAQKCVTFVTLLHFVL